MLHVVTSGATSTTEDDPELLNERPTDARFSDKTKRVIKGAINVLSTYARRTGRATFAEVERMSAAELNSYLVHFYRGVRKWNGSTYSKNAMVSIRYGLQKHFRKSGIDIINDCRFIFANEAFLDVLAKIRRSDAGRTEPKLQALTEEDLRKLYFSDLLAADDPVGLQNKVFVDVMLHLCVRGRENLRGMKRNDFLVATDEAGRRCVAFADGKRDEKRQKGVMYETPGVPGCPVASFQKYLDRINPELDDFWQKPNHHFRIDESPTYWYCNAPVGKNTLGAKMKTLSAGAGLSTVYTNGCLAITQNPKLELEGNVVRRTVGTVKSEGCGGSACRPSQISEHRAGGAPKICVESKIDALRKVGLVVHGGSGEHSSQISDYPVGRPPLMGITLKTYTRRKAVHEHLLPNTAVATDPSTPQVPRSDEAACLDHARHSAGDGRQTGRNEEWAAVAKEMRISRNSPNATRRLRGRRRKRPYPASIVRREISTHRLWVRLSRFGSSREQGRSSQVKLEMNVDVNSEPRSCDADTNKCYVLPCIKSEAVDPASVEMPIYPAVILSTTELHIPHVVIKDEPMSDGEMDQISIGSVYNPSGDDSDT